MRPGPARVTARLCGIGLALILVSPDVTSAHGGGLDGHGCHHDRKRGGYHCHRGPFAGRPFESQAEMLKEQAASSEKLVRPDRPVPPKREPATLR